MPRARSRAILAVIFVALTAMRLVALGRYPDYHSDEGFWANGARNHVLFGDAFLDNRLHPYLTPATYAGLVAHFHLFTPTLATARVFSAICGIATCLLVLWMARRLFPARPWLPFFLFGLSTFPALMQRKMLLEAHQTFWITLAAALLFSRLRGRIVLAGAAFGAAFLVKSNSIYMVPAFAIALYPFASDAAASWGAAPAPASSAAPPEPDAPAQAPSAPRALLAKLFPAASFLFATALVAGAGYAVARAQGPQAFADAFRYELTPAHFLEEIKDPILFHVGRFGLRPYSAAGVMWTFFLNEPFLVLLGAVAVARVLRRPRATAPEDRLFVAWALGGIAFDLIQINVTFRYLGTIAPAVILLGARSIDRMLSAPAEPPAHAASGTSGAPSSAPHAASGTSGAPSSSPRARRELVAAAFFALFALYHVARLGNGILQYPNRTYWETVEFIRANAPKDTGVLAASYFSLSLPQPSYDFYRLLYPYGDESHPRPTAAEVDKKRITLVVRDAEWREYETADMAEFIAARCTKLAEFGQFEVFAVSPRQ